MIGPHGRGHPPRRRSQNWAASWPPGANGYSFNGKQALGDAGAHPPVQTALE